MAAKKKARSAALKKPATRARSTSKPNGMAALYAALVVLQTSLKKGEHFAGIVQENGRWHGVVLLPGELESGKWAEAGAWAKKQGGALPSRREQSLLFANLKDQFQPRWYWSGEQHSEGSAYAWGQLFGYGYQYYGFKDYFLRARAVRRLPLQ